MKIDSLQIYINKKYIRFLLVSVINNHITKLYNFYKEVSDKKQSLTDILNSFSQLSSNNSLEENKSKFIYSSNNFFECPENERKYFIDNQLKNNKTLVINNIRQKQGSIWDFRQVIELVIDKSYYDIEKNKRKVIYPTRSIDRPIGEIGYDIWNGVQIIDLDIKNAELANKLKPELFNCLSKYSWFLSISLSASRKSLHIWTKIQPITIDHDQRKIEYICNFRHKYSYIYLILTRFCEKYEYTHEDVISFIDMAMAKPQQGIFIGSDYNILINTNFNNQRLDVNFEPALNNGVESINWIYHPELKE